MASAWKLCHVASRLRAGLQPLAARIASVEATRLSAKGTASELNCRAWSPKAAPTARWGQQRAASTRAGVGDDRLSLIDCKNGDKAPSLFSEQEYKVRLSKLRAHMSQHGVAATVLTSYHNINYYSGFLYCHFGRFYALVVTPSKTTVIGANVDYGQPWRRAHCDDAITYTDWQRDNYFLAVKTALDGAPGGSIGLEYDHVSLDNFAKFKAALTGRELVDVGVASMRMRLVKSAEEHEVIKAGAKVADLGGAAAVSAIREGVPEYEVALASTQVMVREIARMYPQTDIMDTWTWLQSGLNTDGAHNPVTTKKLERGDIISMNCFPMIQGYYTALERTLFLDHASDIHLKYWEANCEVHRRGLQLIKPGARCCDITHELNDIYRQKDLLQYRTFGYGHSFGSLSHYYGREAGLELREDIETVLEPGMVLSMEPMITIPQGQEGAGGYKEHDILIVTEDGAENITHYPFGPEHNIIKL